MFHRIRSRAAFVAAVLVLTVSLGLSVTAKSEASTVSPTVPGTDGGSLPLPEQALPDPGSQPFTPAVVATGVTLTTYAGGSFTDLEFELQLAFNGTARAFAAVNGELIVLIPNAPAFVNAPFEAFAAGFPDGIPAGTGLLIVVDPYPSEAQESLDQARAAWAQAGSDDYDMQMSVSCFCLLSPDVVGLPFVNLEVRDGVITSAVTVDGTELDPIPTLLVTVEDIFDVIEDAIDARAASIEVTYHADGYPLSVSIDRSFQIADEEIGYTIQQLTLR